MGIAFCFFGHSFPSLLLQVGTCLYMSTIYKDCLRIQIPFIRSSL